jgi:putative endonuclease
MAEHNELGKTGEDIAQAFLENKGFVILEKNWRHRYLEVDIIAFDKNFLVLVEVKTRSDLAMMPQEAVGRKKEKNLIEAAEIYLEMKGLENEVRFDIVAIHSMEDFTKIRHIPDAFSAFSG